MPIGETLLAAGLAGASQGFNQGMTAGNNARQRRWQSQEAEKAWQRDLQMWNMTNAYNTPSAQMQRMAEAGLNPNLIYGNINNMPASASAHYKPAEGKFGLPPLDLVQIQQVAMQTQLLKEQVRSVKIENDEKEFLRDQNYWGISQNKQWFEVKEKEAQLYRDYGIQMGNEATPYDKTKTDTMAYHQLEAIKANNLAKQRLAERLFEEIEKAKYAKNWAKIKENVYMLSGLNIDRDSTIWRVGMSLLSKILPKDAIEYLKKSNNY